MSGNIYIQREWHILTKRVDNGVIRSDTAPGHRKMSGWRQKMGSGMCVESDMSGQDMEIEGDNRIENRMEGVGGGRDVEKEMISVR